MTVTLSPIWGAGAQLFDNNGNPLTGGKIYTYAAGTTTPEATYTSINGNTANTNPIVLDAAGRVPNEVWLTDGQSYKFVLKTSTDVQIASYDNIVGINSSFYIVDQEIQTATAGQTVFTLTTMQYRPGTDNLSVFIDGINQYNFLELSPTIVSFTEGVSAGSQVKFTTATSIDPTNFILTADNVAYTPPFTGGAATNVEDKLAQYVSVKDFGAVGNGVSDDTAAIQAAVNYKFSTGWANIYFPPGTYLMLGRVFVSSKTVFNISPGCTIKTAGTSTSRFVNNVVGLPDTFGYDGEGDISFIGGGTIDCNNGLAAITFAHGYNIRLQDITFTNAEDTHFVEINSSKDVLVDACHFKDMSVVGTGLYEMLQIDYSNIAGFPSFGGYDNTPCTNVIVQNCVFENGHSGVGSHSNPPNGLHTAITITNNTIRNMSAYGIRAQGWGFGSEVSNNYLEDCGEKPMLGGGNLDNVEFLYNTVNRGGTSSSGGFWLSISGSIYGQRCILMGNKVYDVEGEGFYIAGMLGAQVTNNEVHRSSKRGFMLANGTSGAYMTENKVYGCGNFAPNTYDAYYIENESCSDNRLFNNTAKTAVDNVYRFGIQIQGSTAANNRLNNNDLQLGTGARINNNGTLTEINGETFLTAVISATTGDITLLADITGYGGLRIATGVVEDGELYTDYARGWSTTGFRVGTDYVNIKTFSGTAQMTIPAATTLTIQGTASDPIRYVIGVDRY